MGSSPHTRGAPQGRLSRSLGRRDHPRIRGEHNPFNGFSMPTMGSSPHTRGAQIMQTWTVVPDGIIPAYAGSTLPSCLVAPLPWDHPRIRGEHRTEQPCLGRFSGSSPHTRGALPKCRVTRIVEGIIPAYAGSTSEQQDPVFFPRDHPRIRGEHLMSAMDNMLRMGSSPHTRGALGKSTQGLRDRGIIPAYAGSTHLDVNRPRCTRDHPRIRGEHQMISPRFQKYLGSSPHTRGALLVRPRDVGDGGIIPAYAGSTPSCVLAPGTRRDHPRIRGEHYPHPCGWRHGSGSSPHTRGARKPLQLRRSHDGIIPAYAGSTGQSASTPSASGDHPRIRGEH